MKNVRILDCTLRDGGRIINCDFPDNEIKEIANRLSEAKIDIVEMGFLRDWRAVAYQGNSTFFTDVDQIRPFIVKDRNNTFYTAFIDFGMCDIDRLAYYDGTSIDGIRFGFTKENYDTSREEVIRWTKIIKERGYKLFLQGVNSLNYSDLELLEVVQIINDIHPYSFGIVDTYGAMYIDDVDRIYGLIDHNMSEDICINFHSHNNYQLSFAFAQEVIKLSGTGNRQIIIDGTLGGMGKVAGNLNTELIVDFLTRKKNYDYEFEDILDIIDDYIYPYTVRNKWGYSTPAMLAGHYQVHPNNIIYLTNKFRLDTKDIDRLLSMIDPAIRQRYDYDNIEHLYTEYIADKVDDHFTIARLREIMQGKDILVMVPGNSLNTHREKIDEYMALNKPLVISVNFVADAPNSYAFFGNQKRYSRLASKRVGRHIIASSNIQYEKNDYVVNYHSLINRNYKSFENSTVMLLTLLRRISPKKIIMCGFDGFSDEVENNFMDETFQNDRHKEEFSEINRELSCMFNELIKTMTPGCEFFILTPTHYNLQGVQFI